MNPEMMTSREYVDAQTELDLVAGIDCARSLARQYELEASHLQHVRNAVFHSLPIHVENWCEYRQIVSRNEDVQRQRQSGLLRFKPQASYSESAHGSISRRG